MQQSVLWQDFCWETSLQERRWELLAASSSAAVAEARPCAAGPRRLKHPFSICLRIGLNPFPAYNV